jgi:hypothetical protein
MGKPPFIRARDYDHALHEAWQQTRVSSILD